MEGNSIFKSQEKMTANTFSKILCVFMGMQFLFSIFGELLEKGLNLIGYSSMASMETASSTSTTISMFLYAGFIGPIVEELVYRGIVMKRLEKHGKFFALVISSILFGVMHMNLPQGIFATGVGLILGYTAMNYSLKWAIILHIINNCLFGDIMSYALSGFSDNTQTAITHLVIIGFFVVGKTIIIKKWTTIKEFISQHKSEKKTYIYAFTSLGFILFILASTAIAISDLTPLK